MTKISLPRGTARAVAASIIALGSNSLTLAGTGVGGYVGFAATPDSWTTGWRSATAGIVGLVFAVATHALLEDVTAPLYRLISARHPQKPGTARAAATADEAVARARDAARADIERLAARDAHRLDRGDVLLTQADRWQGHDDGTATFQLAPGAYLHYSRDAAEDSVTSTFEFALVTVDTESPAPVRSAQHLYLLLQGFASRNALPDRAEDTDLQTV